MPARKKARKAAKRPAARKARKPARKAAKRPAAKKARKARKARR